MALTKLDRDAKASLLSGEDTVSAVNSNKDLKFVFRKERTAVRLKKELGLLDSVGIIVGIIIGSGIFISPTGVVKYTGSIGLSLVVWVLSGVFSTLGALCYAELGTMIPKSGGDYAYIGECFGEFFAFIYLWVMSLMCIPTRGAVIALTFANYILQPFFINCTAPPNISVKLLALALIGFLTWLNCTNVRAATKVQDFFTGTKIFALTVIILTGMYHLAQGNVQNYKHPFKDSNMEVGSIATSFYHGLFSYAGWNWLNFVVEELKNPYRNLPRAILISLPLCTLIYGLTNVAYFAVLTPAEVLSSSAVALSFGSRTLGVMTWIVPIFVACSTFGSLNGGLFAASRLFFVGSRNGHLPSSLSLVNVNKSTPVTAIICISLLTAFMTLFSNVYSLIAYSLFSDSLFILTSICGLLWLRYKQPNRPRPIKVWLGLPITSAIILLGLVVLPIMENPYEIGCVLATLAGGIPVYFCLKKVIPLSTKIQNINKNILVYSQILTNSLPEEKED